MSIEKIASKIANDAKAVAKENIDAAKKKAWDVVDEANKKAAALIEKAKKNGIDAREKQVVRRKAVASIDGRNVILAKKQELINECFNDAIEKVVSGDRDKYVDFLVSIVKAQGLSKGTISLSESDQEIAAKLSEKLSKEIPGSAFEIAAEPVNIKGGLICRAGTTSYNASIEAIAEDIRGDIGAEVAEVLFGTQEK
jgi:V/A-type H+-transporting ATPase subunit E